jgi:polysaccharide pyruvyl transferase WcaK-like protein
MDGEAPRRIPLDPRQGDPDRTVYDPSDVVKICCLWHSLRQGNLGVGALSIAHLELIRQAARDAGRPVAITVVGHGGSLDYTAGGGPIDREVVLAGARALLDRRLWQSLSEADVVLDIGEGDSFADLYGGRRFAKQMLLKTMALGLGRRLVLAPQTIGPFRARSRLWLARRVLRRAEAILSRDQETTRLMGTLGLGGKTIEFTDLAFALPGDETVVFARQPGRIEVGLNVSGLLYAAGDAAGRRYGLACDYRALIHRLIESMSQRERIRLHLIGHVFAAESNSDDDYATMVRLKRRFPSLVLPEPFASPSAAKGYIGRLDCLIGSRMHATIAALSAGVPVVPVAYSQKFIGVFGALDYPVVGDCRSQSADTLVALVDGVLADPGRLQAAVDRSNAIATGRLAGYRSFLCRLLGRGPER